MMRPTAIVADDEPALRRHLERLLADVWPELEITASVGDGAAALEAVRARPPDVAFLDIRMPEPGGLELARTLADEMLVVFVTAYDAHALEAFERAAVDYVLKPVTRERLEETVRRLQQRTTATSAGAEDGSGPASIVDARLLEALAERLGQQSDRPKHLSWLRVTDGDEVRLLSVDEIDYFRADRKYTSAFTAEGEHLLRMSISQLEEQLDPERFWRIHRSTIVSVPAIVSARRDLRGRFVVRVRGHDAALPVSEAHAHRFRGA